MTARPEWCERADVIGYQQATGQAYVDCKLSNTGSDIPLPVVLMIAVPLVVFGALIRRAARTGRA